jgi:hypothetical protein
MGGRRHSRPAKFKTVGDEMTEDDFRRIENMIARQVGVREEGILYKLDLVVEGQQALAERMDRMETGLQGMDERLTRVELRLTRVETKVDGVAADLAAHRADTEAHRGVYRVREE